MLSICVPTYEMNGHGVEYLKENIESIRGQSFCKWEIVISDNSRSNEIKDFLDKEYATLNIKYLRRERESIFFSRNINHAINNASSKYVQVLFQDDFLRSQHALEHIYKNIRSSTSGWALCGFSHMNSNKRYFRRMNPRWNERIITGKNTIGPPSVLAINKSVITELFDPNLVWLMDCEYYYRLYKTYGKPKVTKENCVVSRIGKHQVSNLFSDKLLVTMEKQYIQSLYSL